MPQSLSHIYIHLVFSTKNREPLLIHDIRPDLHAYMATVLKNLQCPSTVINSVADHVHASFKLARTVTVADAVMDLKKSSSAWLKTQSSKLNTFAWQTGYGAFSVSESNMPQVGEYIRRQEEHHRIRSFQEEYRALLEAHNVAYDERYLWD